MYSNATFTDDVPAPDAPVTVMVGCFYNTRVLLHGYRQHNIGFGMQIKGGEIISV